MNQLQYEWDQEFTINPHSSRLIVLELRMQDERAWQRDQRRSTPPKAPTKPAPVPASIRRLISQEDPFPPPAQTTKRSYRETPSLASRQNYVNTEF